MNVILNTQLFCTNEDHGLRCNYSSKNTRVMKEVIVIGNVWKKIFYVQKTKEIVIVIFIKVLPPFRHLAPLIGQNLAENVSILATSIEAGWMLRYDNIIEKLTIFLYLTMINMQSTDIFQNYLKQKKVTFCDQFLSNKMRLYLHVNLSNI